MNNWIAKYHSSSLKNSAGAKLKDITLIGTHDAGMNEADSTTIAISKKWVVTQKHNIANQLACGARWLDIRLGRKGGVLRAQHHAMFDTKRFPTGGGYGETFDSILRSCVQFVTTNESEFVLIKITHTSDHLINLVDREIKKVPRKYIYSEKFKANIMENRLNELKGKVIILTDLSLDDRTGAVPVKIVKDRLADRHYDRTYLPLRGKYADSTSGKKIFTDQKKKLDKMPDRVIIGHIRGAAKVVPCRQLYWTATGGDIQSHTHKLFGEDPKGKSYLEAFKLLLKHQRRAHIIVVDFLKASRCSIIWNALQERV